MLLGESLSGERANSAKGASVRDEVGSGNMTISIPKLGLEGIPAPTADNQVELRRERIIHLKKTGAPRKEGSNTVIVGHALGYL